MVDLIKVTKIYPPEVKALSDVSLTVRKGEIAFLTGMSGAGKTTLLRLLCRIENPTRGLVEVAGMDLGKLSERRMQSLRRRIGMAYQDFKLLPERSVAQNIAISMEVAYRGKAFIRKKTRELLESLNLCDKHGTPAAELSRGEQQRVTIARALANNPDLILADEPTGNLDATTTGLVMDLLSRHNERGATIIIATHDESILRNSNGQVIELSNGQVVPGGKHTDLVRHSDSINSENEAA
ncbi:MAG: cell division ATP-binding protein FtsE [Desulfobulbaceae bacterium]|nr:cell division ATP-binding protein FtsE [Desulfobulbaceae bacterium]